MQYLSENLPHLPPSYYFTLRFYLFICTRNIYLLIILMKWSFGISLYRQCKIYLIIFGNYVFKYFFLVSTLNSMGASLCSVAVSERLKMRKSLAINYWQDTISDVEVSHNVIKSINLQEFQLVLWFCTIFHFNTIFFFQFIKNRIYQKSSPSGFWCYLVIGCFDWKVGIFQQTVVRCLLYP